MTTRKAELGELETLVMLAVLRLGDGAYGMSIRDEVAERGGRRLTRGATYATISRLERKGFLDHTLGEASSEGGGGRAKRYFRVTDEGLRVLSTSQQRLSQMLDGLETTLGLR